MQYYDEADAGIDGYRPIRTWRLLKFAALLLATATLSYAGFVGFVVVKVTAENMATLKVEKDTMAAKLEAAKAQGVQEGVQSVNIPKKCTAWWFGENSKEKQEQARLAYCKGKL